MKFLTWPLRILFRFMIWFDEKYFNPVASKIFDEELARYNKKTKEKK